MPFQFNVPKGAEAIATACLLGRKKIWPGIEEAWVLVPVDYSACNVFILGLAIRGLACQSCELTCC